MSKGGVHMVLIIPFIGTTLGAACVFFMKKELSKDNNLDVVTFEYNSVTFNDKVLNDLDKYVIDTIQTEATKDELENFKNTYHIPSDKIKYVLSINPY